MANGNIIRIFNILSNMTNGDKQMRNLLSWFMPVRVVLPEEISDDIEAGIKEAIKTNPTLDDPTVIRNVDGNGNITTSIVGPSIEQTQDTGMLPRPFVPELGSPEHHLELAGRMVETLSKMIQTEETNRSQTVIAYTDDRRERAEAHEAFITSADARIAGLRKTLAFYKGASDVLAPTHIISPVDPDRLTEVGKRIGKTRATKSARVDTGTSGALDMS